MSTLLLRFAAPMQSWGTDSKFDRRGTGREPSKSGVIGLCAAALGYERNEDEKMKKISGLRFGVRIDKPGKLIKDFHMVHKDEFWDCGDRSKTNQSIKQQRKNDISYISTRYYLADAAFLVGLSGDNELLCEISAAIRSPSFPLYLGRRCCPPEGRLFISIVADELEDALKNHPPVFETRIVIDAPTSPDSTSHLQRDLPISFNPEHRRYNYRPIQELPHDPLAAVEEVL